MSAKQERLDFGRKSRRWEDRQVPVPQFDGETYDPAKDHRRLGEQARRVFDLMRDSRWRTLAEIAQATGDPEASVSARLRDLRKPRFGGHPINRRRRSAGTFEYRIDGSSKPH